MLVLSRSRSVTPADRSYDLIDAATYNFINSSRPPKILESPLDSKSLSAGINKTQLFSVQIFLHVIQKNIGIFKRLIKIDVLSSVSLIRLIEIVGVGNDQITQHCTCIATQSFCILYMDGI